MGEIIQWQRSEKNYHRLHLKLNDYGSINECLKDKNTDE